VNPAVQYTLRDIMKGKPKVQFKRPSGNKIAQGEQRSIPGFGCISVADAIAKVESAGFTATPGAEVESDCPQGQAAGTEPSGRTIKNGFVSIQVSKGKPGPKGPKPGPSAPPGPR